jgi:hypothetical protein
MIQVRLSLPEFSNGVNFTDPIIMDQAGSVVLTKTVNSSDETLSFEVPSNDPKISYVNYLRWWEAWDTVTNERINYGPIRTISDGSGDTRRVQGFGRSALLEDYYKTIQTFYYPIDRFLDDLRYENIAAQPRTSTIINQNTSSDYYGLSKRSKDNVIDEQTGYIAIGRDVPVHGIKRTDSIWSGVAKADWLVVDLGDVFKISKAKILLPWWGGATKNNDRLYNWRALTSIDNVSYVEQFSQLDGILNPSMKPRIFSDGWILYWGEDGFETHQEIIDADDYLEFRYLKIDILNTFARGSTRNATNFLSFFDAYDWQCLETNSLNGEEHPSPTVSTGDLIDKETIVPASDCHASIVEIGAYGKILNRDFISRTPYQQVDGTNKQITFFHAPAASETFAAGSDKKFEPGGFFRKLTISGGSTVATDEYNAIIYSGGAGSFVCPAYTRMLLFTGGGVTVTQVDTWPTVLSAYSFGGSYSYTEIQDDYFLLDFRGVSLKWYATVPDDKTAGTAKIELRSKNEDGTWNAWQTLEASFQLPSDIAGEKIWEITYESGILEQETSYQLKITNLTNNFISVDSFAGFWSSSYVEFNEDHERMEVRHIKDNSQLFDLRYGSGSIYKLDDNSPSIQTWVHFEFEGDRILLFSRLGPGYGSLKLGIGDLMIPGGDVDGNITVSLEHDFDIPQAVVFDSNDYWVTDGMPWGDYEVGLNKIGGDEPAWFEGFGVLESAGLSVKFIDTSHLEVLKAVCEATQLEWDITEEGLLILPRLGEDTEIIFSEGKGVTIKVENVQDISQVASMLVTSGADIDGLPLTAIIENKTNRQLLNRTIMRPYDLRNIGDYFTLIGAARTELLRRRKPQRRIAVTTTDLRGINHGDSFIVNDKEFTGRVRAMSIMRRQTSGEGTEYTIECLEWPQII